MTLGISYRSGNWNSPLGTVILLWEWTATSFHQVLLHTASSAIQDPIRGLQHDPEAAWLTGVHASMDRGNETPGKLSFPCTYSLGLFDQRLDRPDGYVKLIASALKRPRVVSIGPRGRERAINPTLIAGWMSANLSAACSPRHRREARFLDCL